MLKVIDLLDRDDLTYADVWQLQKDQVEQVAKTGKDEALIFVEHESVLTLGRRSHKENILADRIEPFEIERGGDVTWHGPGQLVIYPIIKLYGSTFGGGLNDYLRFLEQVVIDLLCDYGLDAGRYGETGVWVKHENKTLKIASIGVAVRRWVTYHGIGLNVSNTMEGFESIRPCNFESSIMTSLKALGVEKLLSEVRDDLLDRFRAEGAGWRRCVS